MSNLIVAQLLYLESENPETPVWQRLSPMHSHDFLTATFGWALWCSARLRTELRCADQHVHQFTGRDRDCRAGHL